MGFSHFHRLSDLLITPSGFPKREQSFDAIEKNSLTGQRLVAFVLLNTFQNQRYRGFLHCLGTKKRAQVLLIGIGSTFTVFDYFCSDSSGEPH